MTEPVYTLSFTYNELIGVYFFMTEGRDALPTRSPLAQKFLRKIRQVQDETAVQTGGFSE